MKESLWGYWLVVLGVFVVVVLLLVQSFTSSTSEDYYLVKTITEESLIDAIDYSYYNTYNEIKINKEKFVEVFLRRFAEEASLTNTYTVEFSEIYEAPPKVGVKVSSKSNSFTITGNSESFDIVNKIDSILETKNSAYTKKASKSSAVYYYQNYSDFYGWLATSTDTSAYKNCEYKFESTGCGTGTFDIKVERCGKAADGTKLTYGKEYCIAHKDGDNACTIIDTAAAMAGYCN